MTEKVTNDIEKAKFAGMDRKSIAILEDINKNGARKATCTRHRLKRISTGKYRCDVCGYECSSSYVVGYLDAIDHLECKLLKAD